MNSCKYNSDSYARTETTSEMILHISSVEGFAHNIQKFQIIIYYAKNCDVLLFKLRIEGYYTFGEARNDRDGPSVGRRN